MLTRDQRNPIAGLLLRLEKTAAQVRAGVESGACFGDIDYQVAGLASIVRDAQMLLRNYQQNKGETNHG